MRDHSTTSRTLRLIILAALILVSAACSVFSDDEEPKTAATIYTRVSEGTLNAGDPIPVPDAANVTLTITGLVGNTNDGDQIIMDREALEAVGQYEYTQTDPFEEVEVTHRGVLMQDLLALWGVSGAATVLHMTALNDYTIDVSLADVRQYFALLALQENGAYMEVSRRGPAMLVFPYADFELNETLFNNYWIWQLKSIDVDSGS